MSIRGPKGKRERALGENLLLKGTRSQGPKAAIIRRPYKPGQHGKTGRRKALSDFGRQLQEKQKFKLSYGIDERNLRQIVAKAKRMKGSTGANIVRILESRLDNAVYRMGFAPSRIAARKLVVDGHFFVNGRRVRSPGYALRVNDTITVRAESATSAGFKMLPELLKQYEVPAWLSVDIQNLTGRVVRAPEDTVITFEINLLVESFSK